MDITPIAIFAFNRPEHLRRMLLSLDQSMPATNRYEFWFFIDGPRFEDERKLVSETIAVAQSWSSGRTSFIVPSLTNKGLAASVRQGITQVLKEYESVIVLEDDLILQSGCIQYLSWGLRLFKMDNRVASVQAYSYPLNLESELPYFMRGAGSWGWATWADRWQRARWDSEEILADLRCRSLIKELDFDGKYFYSAMLKEQIEGKIDSWAVPFYCDTFAKGLLSVYPSKSLVINGGMDGSGTHEGEGLAKKFNSSEGKFSVPNVELVVEESLAARRELTKFFAHAFGLRNRLGRLTLRLLKLVGFDLAGSA